MGNLELPDAFVQQMQTLLGKDYPLFLAALEDKPPVSLRLNPRKPGAQFEGASPIPWSPNGLFLENRPRFFLDPLIYAGGFYVQEASSMLIGNLLDFNGPRKILDLCAAPGGKSTLLASLMSDDSLLVSNEIVGNRARILEENISRWGNPNCVVTNNHPADFSRLKGFFDAIVVDAPCSGEGMFRKDPAVIDHWSPRMVRECAARQKEILTAISPALRPGGRLVYSTCTYNREENEAIVEWLLTRDPGEFKLIEPPVDPDWGLTNGDTQPFPQEMSATRHAYPHQFKGEGFFFAVLEKQRQGRFDQDVQAPPKKKKYPPKQKKGRFKEERKRAPILTEITKKTVGLVAEWVEDAERFEWEILGESVHAFPVHLAEDMRFLNDKLRVLNAGVRVGKPKGKDLIPAHDLAMSTAWNPALPQLALTYEEALHYLKRAEFSPETGGLSGWTMPTYQGIPLGWMKVLSNRVNNHFPKEMRIRSEISQYLD